eukprot:XP_011667925.1 PREDICTED: fibropellin-1-like [Strongylocentrotus purpuratus]
MCETDIDYCSTTPCMNGGICIDEVNNFTCNCAAGYKGDTCQTVLCDLSNCQNGGTCTPFGQPCNCPPGFTGDLCENAPQGLSNGAIIVLALGIFGFVLVFLSLVCFVFVQGFRRNQAMKPMLA